MWIQVLIWSCCHILLSLTIMNIPLHSISFPIQLKNLLIFVLTSFARSISTRHLAVCTSFLHMLTSMTAEGPFSSPWKLSSNLLLEAVIYLTEPGELLSKIFLMLRIQNSVTSTKKFVTTHTLEYLGPAVIKTTCSPVYTRQIKALYKA